MINEEHGVCWSAVFAGAATAAALTLILFLLGTGLGLSAISPWKHEGISAATFSVSVILWITLTQLIVSALGGYLAGRLRNRWTSIHVDEVFFRDTAHGFLTWAIATLATAALLTSVIGSIVSGGVQAGASVVGGAAKTATHVMSTVGSEMQEGNNDNNSMGYFVDSLFRQDTKASVNTPVDHSKEVTRIFTNSINSGELSNADTRYVGQLVAQRTSLSQEQAEQRVSATYTRIQEMLTSAKEAADKARKASAYAALWFFVALLIGAFSASLAATWGGRHRDL
ncbi:MAG: hypothetical protein H0W44_06090 [Gammaproteobacteria bacterium]|nr:hypothetical protein [Gammaproteobacteria bacterium]